MKWLMGTQQALQPPAPITESYCVCNELGIRCATVDNEWRLTAEQYGIRDMYLGPDGLLFLEVQELAVKRLKAHVQRLQELLESA